MELKDGSLVVMKHDPNGVVGRIVKLNGGDAPDCSLVVWHVQSGPFTVSELTEDLLPFELA